MKYSRLYFLSVEMTVNNRNINRIKYVNDSRDQSLIIGPLLWSSEGQDIRISSGNQSPHPYSPLGISPKPRAHHAAVPAKGWKWSYVYTHHDLSEFGLIFFFFN